MAVVSEDLRSYLVARRRALLLEVRGIEDLLRRPPAGDPGIDRQGRCDDEELAEPGGLRANGGGEAG